MSKNHHHYGLWNLALLILLTVYIIAVKGQEGSTTNESTLTDHQVYNSWLESSANKYDNYVFLTNSLNEIKVAIHWTINKDYINLAVAARAEGWLGFGLSEAGGMPGADIVYYTVTDGTLTDAYATKYGQPTPDSCQDWNLVDSVVKEGLIIWEGTRLLNTEDSHDRIIENDSMESQRSATKIIAAFGNSPSISYHGSNRFKTEVRFFQKAGQSSSDAYELFQKSMEQQSVGSFVLKQRSYEIPKAKTTYATVCIKLKDLSVNGIVHAIGFEPVIENKAHVHHILLRASESDSDLVCSGAGALLAGWAKGAPPHELPSNVGFLIGDGHSDAIKSFQMEIHYDNPDQTTGIVDNSGIRIYYTDDLREHDAGVLQLGDPFVVMQGSSVGDAGFSSHSFTCPSVCTQTFTQEEITVFSEFLHMHDKGTRMVNKQIRGSETVRKGFVDYFDFNQSGGYTVPQKPFNVKRGDVFETECFFHTEGKTNFGYASSDEMCIAYLFYYPKQNFVPLGICGYKWINPFCTASYKGKDKLSESSLDRVFADIDDRTNDNCSTSVTGTPTKVPVSSPTKKKKLDDDKKKEKGR